MRKKVLNMDYSESFIPAMMDMLARQQGEIFLYAQQHGYSLDDFIPKYMHSDFCNREMDAEFSFFHFKMAESCFPYIQQELRLKQGADTIGDAYWVGMMYRYLVLATGRPSREIVENISPSDLDDLGVAYECYSSEEAVQEIVKRYLPHIVS